MSVEIYSKEDCGYCAMAKTLLNSKNIPYTEHVLGIHFTREQLLAKYSLAKTFPVVVVDGYYIGGYNNLVEHVEKNPVAQVLVEEPPAAAELPTDVELNAIAVAAAVAVDQAEQVEVVTAPTEVKTSRRYSR